MSRREDLAALLRLRSRTKDRARTAATTAQSTTKGPYSGEERVTKDNITQRQAIINLLKEHRKKDNLRKKSRSQLPLAAAAKTEEEAGVVSGHEETDGETCDMRHPLWVDRVPELQQKRRVHRHPLCLYGDPSRVDRHHHLGRTHRRPSTVEPSAQHQVQRGLLSRAARRPGGLQPRGPATGCRPDPFLPRQCAAAPRGSRSRRNHRLRRSQCPLCLVEDTRRSRQLDLF